MQEISSFGNWLRLKRKSLDLTREGLADLVGCSVATIRKLEAEERLPSEQIAERLATIFKIPENDQKTFIQYARGDWQSAPAQPSEEISWGTGSKSPRSNIPATTTTLIAREKEIALVHEYLSKDNIPFTEFTRYISNLCFRSGGSTYILYFDWLSWCSQSMGVFQ